MKADKDNVVRIFARPLVSEDAPAEKKFSPAVLLSFRNAVLALGVVTLLIFIGSTVAPRIALLFAALLGLAFLLLAEMATRRRWERQMTAQIARINGEYERLVRDVARNRNELLALRKTLADVGTAARSHDKTEGEAAERRMARSIAEQLARLNDAPAEKAPAKKAEAAAVAAKPSAPPAAPLAAPPPALADAEVLALLKKAISEDAIDLFIQPIVTLPQRKIRFYETFSRLRAGDGRHLPAERYITLAAARDLMPAIDNLLLLRTLQFVRDAGEAGNRAFFCNITSLTLHDPKFMGDLVEFIAQNRNLAPWLVFELSQDDLATMGPEALPVLEGLSRLGCRFSMDRVRGVSFDFAHLEARHIRFVKVDAATMLEEVKQPGGLPRLRRLKAELDRAGIDLIVEKIENEKQVRELLDVEIDFGQGFLFGHPEAA